MSAYICNNKTVNRIVSMLDDRSREADRRRLSDLNHPLVTDEDRAKFGEMLRMMNVGAVMQRYPDLASSHDAPGTVGETSCDSYQYSYEWTEPIQAYKTLQCWLYQCGEGNVPEMELYQELEKVNTRQAREIVSRLDAYNAAEWD